MISGWYYAKAGASAGHEIGPLSWQELYLLALNGTLAPTDLVWNPKLPRGVAARQIPGLFPEPQSPVTPPTQPAPQMPPVAAPVHPPTQFPAQMPPAAALDPLPAGPPTLAPGWLPAEREPLAPGWLPAAGEQPAPGPLPPVPPAITPTVPAVEAAAKPSEPVWERAAYKPPVETEIHDLFAEKLGEAEDSEPLAEQATPKHIKREHPSLPWLVVLLALVVAAAGLAAYFLYLRDTGDGQGGPARRSTTTTAPGPTTTTTPPVSAPGAWTEVVIAGAVPAARKGHSLVYDPNTRKAVLFGGSDLETTYGDTWTLDTGAGAWTELAPSGQVPSEREYHQMVYDPVGKRLIMFGGGSSVAALNDTWSFDPVAGTWTELHPTGELPPILEEHAMVYDPVSRRVILFGGWNGDSTEMINETWAYDAAANTWIRLSPLGTLPAKRMGHSLVYDPASHRVILFGGFGGPSATTGADLNDTWAYDPAANTWTQLTPAGNLPAARQGQAMVLDPRSGDLILYGGSDGVAELDDTWSYDPNANSWTELEPLGGAPAGREDHVMVYDEASATISLFGGSDLLRSMHFGDTWDYGGQATGGAL
jgi:N-acetylneuraminic acid mutarotase